ncbi:hypothetical protein STPH1_3373 [Streptomyces sp. OM5714]|nr:hypothetical protein STPH1_3373 [Streptomyces sp. OM5714]
MPLCRRCHRRYDVTIHRHGSMRAADFDRLKSAAWDRITDERRELDAGRRDTQIRLWLAWNGYADKTPEPEPTEPEQAPIVRAAICVREGCHEVVPYRGKGRPAKFCSTTCRSGSDRTEKATACRVCGVQIPQSGTGRPRVTCSAQCRQVIFKARKRTQIEADRSTARREYEAAMGDE